MNKGRSPCAAKTVRSEESPSRTNTYGILGSFPCGHPSNRNDKPSSHSASAQRLPLVDKNTELPNVLPHSSIRFPPMLPLLFLLLMGMSAAIVMDSILLHRFLLVTPNKREHQRQTGWGTTLNTLLCLPPILALLLISLGASTTILKDSSLLVLLLPRTRKQGQNWFSSLLICETFSWMKKRARPSIWIHLRRISTQL